MHVRDALGVVSLRASRLGRIQAGATIPSKLDFRARFASVSCWPAGPHDGWLACGLVLAHLERIRRVSGPRLPGPCKDLPGLELSAARIMCSLAVTEPSPSSCARLDFHHGQGRSGVTSKCHIPVTRVHNVFFSSRLRPPSAILLNYRASTAFDFGSAVVRARPVRAPIGSGSCPAARSTQAGPSVRQAARTDTGWHG